MVAGFVFLFNIGVTFCDYNKSADNTPAKKCVNI